MKKKTIDLILESSLTLFNQYGVNDISTNYISEFLNISPGNLYYHFRNKEDIIKTIISTYIKELKLLFINFINFNNFENKNTLSFYNILYDIFSLIWNYRFLYISASDFLQNLHNKMDLKEKYNLIKQQTFDFINYFIDLFIERKWLDSNKNKNAHLISNLEMFVAFWVPYEVIINGKHQKTECIENAIHKFFDYLSCIETEKGEKIIHKIKNHREMNLTV